jgi:hypothetical protein
VASVAGTDQTSSVLGFHPAYAFEKGLEMTYAWYKDSMDRGQ